MAFSSPIGVIVQNLWLHWTFFASFLVLTFLTGAWFGLLIAFIVGSVVSFLYRKFINRQLPVPRKSAVLITGCSSGIGFDAAIRLTKLGFMTFATVRKSEDGEKLRKAAGNSSMLQIVLCDVTKEEDRAKAFETVKSKMAVEGRKLLGLINNAGYSETVPIELASADTMRKQYETNVFSVILLSQLFLPMLREAASENHWARIINVTSVAGRISFPGAGLYASSKHALEAISDSMRMELARWKIHVAIIEPGVIKTQFYDTLGKGGDVSLKSAKESLDKGKLSAGSAVYEKYAQSMEKVTSMMSKLPGEGPEVVSDSIEAAMLDSKPLARYMSAFGTLPMHIIYKLPSEFVDFVFGRDWR